MKHITKVWATALKGADWSYELDALNLITGNNFSRKSSIMDAIQIALTGKHSNPDIEDTNAGIFAFASAEAMEVGVQFDDGKELSRSYVRSKKGSISAGVGLGCVQVQFPDVLMDAKAYLSKSDRERVKYVFSLVPIKGAESTCEDLVQALSEAPIEGVPAQVIEALNLTYARIQNEFEENDCEVQEHLERLVATLKASQSSLTASIKTMTGTVNGLTELAKEPPKDVTKELEQARTALEALVKEQAALEAEIVTAQRTAKRRAELEVDLNGIKEPSAQESARLKNDVLLLEKQGNELPVSGTDKLRTAWKSATKERDKAMEAGQQAKQELERQQDRKNDRDRLIKDIATLQKEAIGLAELEAELAKPQVAGSQLTAEDSGVLTKWAGALGKLKEVKCQYASKDIGSIVSRSNQLIPDTSVLKNEVINKRASKRELERSNDRLATLGTDADLSAAERNVASKKKLYEAQVEVAKLAEAAVVRSEADDKSAQDIRALFLSKKDELARLMEGPNKAQALRKALTELGPVGRYEDIDAGDLVFDKMEGSIQVKREKIDNLDVANRQYIAHKGEALSKQRAVQARSKLEAELAVTKCAVGLVEQKQAAMVQDAFGSILEVANKVTHGILRGSLAYKDGDVGMQVEDRFWCHKTMSGTEQALAYAAMSVSLAVQSPLKLVLLDEMGRLDERNKRLLVLQLQGLLKDGTIDQCVLVDAVSPEQARAQYPLDEMNWISL